MARRWQNLAAPDDPGSWYDVDGLWPTNRGTYETVDFTAATTLTATGRGSSVVYAWCGKAASGTDPEFFCDGTKIWQYNGGALTDVTATATVGSTITMAQFGNFTIAAMGTATATALYAGSAFATLSGSPPKAKIALVVANVALLFNTNVSPDGWAASDVGDVTNWTTGESASGRIYQHGGPILGAVAFGNDAIVFKENSIYRMRYVGGVVKWTVECVWVGSGLFLQSGCASGASGILYAGYSASDAGSPAVQWTWFDGASAPVLVNPFTNVGGGVPYYDAVHDRFMVQSGTTAYYFDPKSRAWGKWTGYAGGVAVDGDGAGRREASSTITSYKLGNANEIVRNAVSASVTGTVYAETTKLGQVDRKTTFSRVTPLLRRRVESASPSASLSSSFFRERENTTAEATLASSESSYRHRFDIDGIGATDNFARFKVSYANMDVEIDDVKVATVDAGED